jgi:hypothetical protein
MEEVFKVCDFDWFQDYFVPRVECFLVFSFDIILFILSLNPRIVNFDFKMPL